MYYVPIEPFAAGDDVVVPDPDVVYTEDHPLVKAYPSRFKPLTVLGRDRKPVEQATAAPGESRQTRRR